MVENDTLINVMTDIERDHLRGERVSNTRAKVIKPPQQMSPVWTSGSPDGDAR